jgi:hypothetical protein
MQAEEGTQTTDIGSPEEAASPQKQHKCKQQQGFLQP